MQHHAGAVGCYFGDLLPGQAAGHLGYSQVRSQRWWHASATMFKIPTDWITNILKFHATTGATALSCATGTLITPNDVTVARDIS